VAPSVRPSQHIMHGDLYVDTPLTYSLITNTATQFLGGNLLQNSLGILHMWDTEWFEQYSIHYLNLINMHVF
jgi:hypothetical protein